jgi:hypothetical protein
MEGSRSTHEHAPASAATSAASTTQGGNRDRSLTMTFLGTVLAMYLTIGIAIYAFVSALL